MTIVTGIRAMQIAKNNLPPAVQEALGQQRPISEIILLCGGREDFEELARKCHSIWSADPEHLITSKIALRHN